IQQQAQSGPPNLYTKVASTARRIFDHQCKKTFATQSANTGLMHCSKNDHLIGARVLSDAPINPVRDPLPCLGTAQAACRLRRSRLPPPPSVAQQPGL